jgi:VanZ family protein
MRFFSQKNIFSWGTVGTLAVLIFVFSIIPVGDAPGLQINNIDKILHFAVYSLFAMLISGTLKIKNDRGMTRIFLFTLISAGVYGILIELVQQTLPYRDADFVDIYCNLFGIFTGIIVNKVITW